MFVCVCQCARAHQHLYIRNKPNTKISPTHLTHHQFTHTQIVISNQSVRHKRLVQVQYIPGRADPGASQELLSQSFTNAPENTQEFLSENSGSSLSLFVYN